MTMTMMMMMASVFTKMPRFARLAFPLGAMDSARRASTQQLSIQLLPPKAYLSILLLQLDQPETPPQRGEGGMNQQQQTEW